MVTPIYEGVKVGLLYFAWSYIFSYCTPTGISWVNSSTYILKLRYAKKVSSFTFYNLHGLAALKSLGYAFYLLGVSTLM